MGFHQRLAFWAFWPLLVLWTWKLVESRPLPEGLDELFTGSVILRIAAAKTLHAWMYLVLTVLAGVWVPKRRPPLSLALALLMLHAVATEVIQTMVPNRTGRAYDVIIDWAGIGMGLWVARSKWRAAWGR